jgi:signal transduction histidine kinase
MMLIAMTGKAINHEVSYPLKSGTSEWYHISMNPVKDTQDKIIGLCCSAINITLEKLAEIKHSRITNDLVQRNKDLEQFSYIVSHNLRAPLANITGLALMLRQDGLSLNEKTEMENLLFQSITRLNEIIDDLNHILQDRRKMNENKEQVVFSDLLSDILTGFYAAMERENIQVLPDFSEADSIFTIKAYLYNIFFNLLSNSIKYRQPGIPAKVEIKSWREGHKIIIVFKDNGRGISLRGKGKEVFGLYKRFHPDVDGKGMGLFMVNYQVEILGGNIDIQSRPGFGTTFIITLP